MAKGKDDTEDLWAKEHRDTRTTDELIKLAFEEWKLDDEDYRRIWPNAIAILHFRGNREVFEAARALCKSSVDDERAVGAAILGQLGVPERTFPDECREILLGLLESEKSPDVLEAALIALGHFHNEKTVKRVVKFKNHPDAIVRYGLTFALLGFEDDLAIATLIELSEDEDEDVRDWATFGIGSMIERDTPEIREVLFRRLNDPHEDVQFEAMAGLAIRKDRRVLDRIVDEISEWKDISALCEGLQAMKDDYKGDPKKLAAALALCCEEDENDADDCL